MYKLNLQNLEENNWMGSKITKSETFIIDAGIKKFEI